MCSLFIHVKTWQVELRSMHVISEREIRHADFYMKWLSRANHNSNKNNKHCLRLGTNVFKTMNCSISYARKPSMSMFPDHLNHSSRFYGHSGSHILTMYEEESTCLSWFIGSIKFSKELSTLQTSLFITRSRLFANLHWTMKEQSKTAVCSWQGMAPVAISRRTCRANRYLKIGGIL